MAKLEQAVRGEERASLVVPDDDIGGRRLALVVDEDDGDAGADEEVEQVVGHPADGEDAGDLTTGDHQRQPGALGSGVRHQLVDQTVAGARADRLRAMEDAGVEVVGGEGVGEGADEEAEQPPVAGGMRAARAGPVAELVGGGQHTGTGGRRDDVLASEDVGGCADRNPSAMGDIPDRHCSAPFRFRVRDEIGPEREIERT